MLDWKEYSTSALYSIQVSLENEIKRRTETGDIPPEFKCDVCHYEIQGDSHAFDEHAQACDVCYETNYRGIRKDVAEWEAWLEKVNNESDVGLNNPCDMDVE